MEPHRTIGVLAGTAAPASSTPDGARESLDVRRPMVAFDGASLAVAARFDAGHRSLASVDETAQTVGSLAGPTMPGTSR